MDMYDNVFFRPYKANDIETLLNQIDKNDLARIYYTTCYDPKVNPKKVYMDYISKNYLVTVNNLLNNCYSEILDLIYLLVDHNGEIEYINREPMQAVCMMAYCIAFPVKRGDKNILVMSHEVLSFFKGQDRILLYKNISVNDLVIKYCRGLISIYGIFEISYLLFNLKKFENIKLTIDDIQLLLNIDGLFSDFYSVRENTVHIDIVSQIPNFYDNYSKMKELPCFECTKDMILNGVNSTEEVVLRFKEYCEQIYQMNEDQIDHILFIINEYLKMSIPTEELVDFLDGTFKYNFYRNKMIIKSYLKEFDQSTRKWILRGHTEAEYKLIKNDKLIPFKKL
ncbi:MAG: SecC motif-containing protein [Haloplasmataceae bacterium]|jgi:hypothetical protein|nr:SecC motif-containing protein [Haloplasmataceae bacterium]